MTAGKRQPSVLKDNVMDKVTMKEEDGRQATRRFWKSHGVMIALLWGQQEMSMNTGNDFFMVPASFVAGTLYDSGEAWISKALMLTENHDKQRFLLTCENTEIEEM